MVELCLHCAILLGGVVVGQLYLTYPVKCRDVQYQGTAIEVCSNEEDSHISHLLSHICVMLSVGRFYSIVGRMIDDFEII